MDIFQFVVIPILQVVKYGKMILKTSFFVIVDADIEAENWDVYVLRRGKKYMCKEKKQSAYLLATGSEATDDYDVNVGVFLDEDALKQAYLQLIERKQQEMKQQGYSIVETIKIYKFPHINALLDDFCVDLKINPETLGLPKVVDEMVVPWKP